MLDLPTLSLVISSAAIDAINPCAIGVLILLISVILGRGNKRTTRQLLKLGIAYVSAVFLTYLLAGLGLLYVIDEIPLIFAQYLSLFIGSIIMVAAAIEIKDFFWYGRGPSLSIPSRFANKIFTWSQRFTTVPTVMFLGMFVSAVELPCTGGPYLAVITLLQADFNFAAFLMMVLYNLVFISPLIIILLLVATGTKISRIAKLRDKIKGATRLLIGVLLAVLSWLLILIAGGSINLS